MDAVCAPEATTQKCTAAASFRLHPARWALWTCSWKRSVLLRNAWITKDKSRLLRTPFPAIQLPERDWRTACPSKPEASLLVHWPCKKPPPLPDLYNNWHCKRSCTTELPTQLCLLQNQLSWKPRIFIAADDIWNRKTTALFSEHSVST